MSAVSPEKVSLSKVAVAQGATHPWYNPPPWEAVSPEKVSLSKVRVVVST